jgi:predicted nicotinamide N-methyase
VVELGAGTGIPGIFLASKGARVVLTDLPDVRVAQTSPYAHRTTVSLVSQLSTLTMASIHRSTATATTTTTGVAAHEVERRSQRPLAALA